MNYYNEWDKSAAAWLRELIKAGLIPPGDVDERSITEIKPNELTRYTQCHFFAGIGGWSLALQLAGWPSDRPVWTGSCPCQPFSLAGKQSGNSDERHLWPAFFGLIRECRPESVFGEQVEGAIAHGWLDSVSSDLEGEGYAVGSAILGAHSVGAPHRRQRLYWVADANLQRRAGFDSLLREEKTGRITGSVPETAGSGPDNTMDNPDDPRLNRAVSSSEGTPRHETWVCVPCDGQPNGAVEHAEGDGREQRGTESGGRGIECGCSNGVALGNADLTGSQGRGLQSGDQSDLFKTWARGVDFVACTDGRKRLVKSGIFPLAHGVSGRVGLLRGSGNAIVPQVAAAFIQASEEARGEIAGRAGSGLAVTPMEIDWL